MPQQPIIGPLKSSPILHRHPGNPVLTAREVPYKSSLVYNAGVAFYQGQYVMVFRNDVFKEKDVHSWEETSLGLATSRDGIRWTVASKPCFQWSSEEIRRVYDPRLTVLEDRVCLCFAVDTRHGLRGGIALTDDFEHFEVKSLTVPDNRNMVVFPEKIGGKYFRLERPFPVYSRGLGYDRFDTWYSDSSDLCSWGNSDLLFGVEHVPFANDKVGPGAPPVKTSKGWLLAFHAVDIDPSRGKNGWEPAWRKRYTAGIMLLDLEDPRRVIGMSPDPLIAPEAPYETDGGLRNNVIFPGGMILEKSGEVKIYYGAADTVECLATADVGDLLAACQPVSWRLSRSLNSYA
ncbi:MAG: glycoside hydrolase family 130 protein [Kiritimatiellia bacterium]|nr:glycoside hydrolase family 130 protein [Kiritimatiellia bacterium]